MNLKENYINFEFCIFILCNQVTLPYLGITVSLAKEDTIVETNSGRILLMGKRNKTETTHWLRFYRGLKQQKWCNIPWFCFGPQSNKPLDGDSSACKASCILFTFIISGGSSPPQPLPQNTYHMNKEGRQRESREKRRKYPNYSQGKVIKPMHWVSFLRLNYFWQKARGAFKIFPPVNMSADAVTV